MVGAFDFSRSCSIWCMIIYAFIKKEHLWTSLYHDTNLVGLATTSDQLGPLHTQAKSRDHEILRA